MRLEQVLKVAVRGGASDIILKVDSLPRFRHQGNLVSLADGEIISPEMIKSWVQDVLPSHLKNQLATKKDVDFAFDTSFNARFRASVFHQRGHLGMVLRIINNTIRSIEELQLPKVIENVCQQKRGLVLVTGATGSGKSTTLASLIQKINTTRSSHIITIEDPIEFFYQDHQSTINQREIGEDTPSYPSALKASLRQDPDILLVGELRDAESVETALMAAETGHLVLSTLHTRNAVDCLTRLMSYFSPQQHKTIRMQLANTLYMVVSQRLVPRADNRGRAVAMEILRVNSFVRETILSGDHFDNIKDAIEKGAKSYGMQSFDQSLLHLYNQKIISKEQALLEASSKENMRLLMSGVSN